MTFLAAPGRLAPPAVDELFLCTASAQEHFALSEVPARYEAFRTVHAAGIALREGDRAPAHRA